MVLARPGAGLATSAVCGWWGTALVKGVAMFPVGGGVLVSVGGAPFTGPRPGQVLGEVDTRLHSPWTGERAPPSK